IAAPHTAFHAGRHRHAVGKCSGIRGRLNLSDHDPADRSNESKVVDMLIAKRVDSARMPAAADLANPPNQLQRHLPARVLEYCEHSAQFFSRKRVLPTDVFFLDDQESAMWRDRESSKFGNPGGWPRNRLRSAVSV